MSASPIYRAFRAQRWSGTADLQVISNRASGVSQSSMTIATIVSSEISNRSRECIHRIRSLRAFYSQKMRIWVNKVNQMMCLGMRMWRMEKTPGHGVCTANSRAGRPAPGPNIPAPILDPIPDPMSLALFTVKPIIG